METEIQEGCNTETNTIFAASGPAPHAAKHLIIFLLAFHFNMKFIHATAVTTLHYVATRQETEKNCFHH